MAVSQMDLVKCDSFIIGDWTVEPALNRLSRGHEERLLEPKTMAVLVYLAAHQNRVVSGDALLTAVWDNRPMGDNPIYKCIGQLRKALGDDRRDPVYIATVPKKGYRLIAGVSDGRPEARWQGGAGASSAVRRGWPWRVPRLTGRWQPLVASALLLGILSAALFFRPAGDDIEGAVTGNVAERPSEAGDPGRISACKGTDDLAACQRYKMAHEHLRGRDENYKTKAIALFQEAIALDPGFAAAHASLAQAYLVSGDEIPWAEAVKQAELAVYRAIELDDALPETYLARALVLMTDKHGPCPPACQNVYGYEGAEWLITRALALRPEFAVAHAFLGLALYGQGRPDEAASHIETALRYDPLSPFVNYYVGLDKALRGDYEGARAHTSEFIENHPAAPSYMLSLQAHIESFYGNFGESLDFLRRRMEHAFNPAILGVVAGAYHDLGMFERMEDLLAPMNNEVYHEPMLASARSKLLSSRGELQQLEVFSTSLAERAAGQYGPLGEWPRWLLQLLGQSMFALGDYEQAVAYLELVHGKEGERLDHHRLVHELDSLHSLAYSLERLGDSRGRDIAERSLELIAARKARGYGGFPDLTVAEARAYALQGRRALAVATMRQAVAQGWRRYFSLGSDDPRWAAVIQEPDFQSLLEDVDREVGEMRELVERRFATAEWEKLAGGAETATSYYRTKNSSSFP